MPVVVYEVLVPQGDADRVQGFWEDVYRRITDGEITYNVRGYTCTSLACQSLEGIGGLPAIMPGVFETPSNFSDLLTFRLTHTCGPKAGRPADLTIYYPDGTVGRHPS